VRNIELRESSFRNFDELKERIGEAARLIGEKK